MGDYTLLCTYEYALSQTGSELVCGNVQTAGCENENGYMAVSSFRNLNINTLESSPAGRPGRSKRVARGLPRT